MPKFLLLPFLTFPAHELFGSLEEYYSRTRQLKAFERANLLENKKSLNEALESDERFVEFWSSRFKERSMYDEYYSNVLNGTQPFHGSVFRIPYGTFLFHQKLSEIPNCDREKLQAELDAIRSQRYQRIMEAEATRLNCDISDIRPMVPVLPLEQKDNESKLCQLPEDVFIKIVSLLECIEIFRFTLVSKKWSQFVYKNSTSFKRVEHSTTTHLLTFTQWMDPTRTITNGDCLNHFEKIGWPLVQWCCNTFHNLETLILNDFDRSYNQIVPILKKRPNLKHLHFNFKAEEWNIEEDFSLTKLESLIMDGVQHTSSLRLVLDALRNLDNLQCFKGKLREEDLTRIEIWSPLAFSNLIALELTLFSPEIFEKLSQINQPKLRFLRLGESISYCHTNESLIRMTDQDINAFHSLLARLNDLEVLISFVPGLNYDTIKVLTKLKPNLKQAIVWLTTTSSQNQDGEIDSATIACNGQATLTSFANMLMEKDPSVDLSSFEFMVDDEQEKSILQKANIGFQIYNIENRYFISYDDHSISHPVMRRKVGTDF